MSHHRGLPPEKANRAWTKPDGKCRWCEKDVTPPRRTFCGEECIHQWKLRSDPSYRRKRIFERDGGICATCGRDCHALERDLLTMLHTNPSRLDGELERLGMVRHRAGSIDHRLAVEQPQAKQGARKRLWDPSRTLWEADHILAVVDGGGSCDLSNLQTLCWACHATKTAELATRRAEARRNVRPPPDLFPEPVRPPADLFDPDAFPDE